MTNFITQKAPSKFIEEHKYLYESFGFLYKNLIFEDESQDYNACNFELNNKKIKFRTAKITPIKAGQFVTFWKRNTDKYISPYDVSDHFDFLIVSVKNNEKAGQFIFSKQVLYKYGVLSKNNKGGKRAIRLYPPWDIATSKQAKETQSWQKLYFLEINDSKFSDANKLSLLLF